MSNTMILADVADNSTAWDRKTSATGVAMAEMDDTWYVAAGHSDSDGDRYTLFSFDPDGATGARLSEITGGGTDWGDGRSCTALAFGTVGTDTYVAAGRDGGSGARFEICKFNGTNLSNPVTGGDDWGDSRTCTAVGFCSVGDDTYATIGRDDGTGSRFYLFKFNGTDLADPVEGGSDWAEDAGCSALSACVIGTTTYLAVGRDYSKSVRFFIYRFDGSTLTSVKEGGDDWGDGRACTSLQFTTWKGVTYLVVGRTNGENAKVYLYTFDGTYLTQVGDAGDDWGDGRSCTGVAFANDGSNLYVLAGRDAGENARVYAYRVDTGGLTQVADNEIADWGDGVGVDSIAAAAISTGVASVAPFTAVTRTADSGQRLVIYELTTV